VSRVLAAIVGAAGLPPVHAALAAGKGVALANKESLVVAGGLLTALAARTGARILPIDSEHVALHQALRAGSAEEVRRLVLTASGGPFLHRDEASWETIRPEEALRHPTWRMGAKITVDSATLMNKGLELIEASHLFGLPPEHIDVVVHPQSIVHSLVEYRDGSWIAQLARNEMVFPIQYALAYPERWENTFPRLDLAALGQLTFLALDDRRFPSVRMARQALAAGPSAPAVLNAANEVAVAAFLGGEVPFPAIFDTVAEVLDRHRPEPVADLDAALAWDAWGRREAEELLARLARPR
jgi:1-deoxy-D-xylulose-5-phosphate reductoisomerase